MSPLVLLAILGLGALVLTSGSKAPKPGASSTTAPGSLAGVATKDDRNVWTFTPEAAVGLWRALLSHAYQVDSAVSGRVIVAPEASGAALPKGKAATDWALSENGAPKSQYILAPIYMAFDSKGTRYLRAAGDAAIATAASADQAVYAVLAAPGAAAALDAEANADKTPMAGGPAGKIGGAGPVGGGGAVVGSPSAGVGAVGGSVVPGTAAAATVDHDLTVDDVGAGPAALATAAGLPNVEALLAINPGLRKVMPPDSGWPPVAGPAFGYAYTDPSSEKAASIEKFFVATGRIGVGTTWPTFVTGDDPDNEYLLLGAHPSPGGVGWTGPPPILVTAGSEGKIYGVPSSINPDVVLYAAIVPWAVGQTVKVPADHPLLSL